MEKLENEISLYQVSEISVSYRPNIKASERPKLNSPQDAYEILSNSWDMDRIELQEQFKVMFLNRACRVIGIYEVSSGSMSGTLADPKLIFAAALKSCASAIILCHNHPSGNLKPSRADLDFTSKLKSAGKLLEIDVHDHLIISVDGYYSLADNGLM